MDIDAWWGLIERARAAAGERADDRDAPDDPLVSSVLDAVMTLEPAEIIAFGRHLAEVKNAAYLRPLWAAAYLIEGGCGDDAFSDFRAGLVLQGRERFEHTVRDPDSLADHPVVIRMAAEADGWIGCEEMNYVPRTAYASRNGDTAAYDEHLSTVVKETQLSGVDWDFDNDEQNRVHLPRLSGLFLPD